MNQADHILAHGILLTMNDHFEVLADGAVAIAKDNIIAVGPTVDILRDYRSDDVLDCAGQAIMPGLVNAHTHAAMTLLRGLADDLRLDVWLVGYMMPTEREFVTPEFVRVGTSLACAEMIQSGITTFNDMYYFEESAAQAAADAGIRAVCGQTVMKYPAPDAASFDDSLHRCRQFIQQWKGHPLIIPAVAPHAPYSCTEEILQACTDMAVEFDVPLHIHISETAFEVAENRKQHGMPVVPWIKKLGLFGAKVIAAHCVHLDEGEIRTLHHHGAGVAHNPTSNLKLASGIAPIPQMLEVGLDVGIGTDGPASNNDLDMLEETRLAALIAKVATDNPTTLPARDALAMATRLGARALHIGDITGTLEVGKRADIAVISVNELHNMPHFRRDTNAIYSQIVYAAKSTDVKHVMVNGRWLMRDRQLLTVTVDDLLTQSSDIAEHIDQFLVLREGDIRSKLLAIGELQQEESFEIQVKAKLSDPSRLEDMLRDPEITIVQQSHYRQHDTYFEFGTPQTSRVRYREDDFLDDKGVAQNVRARLTLVEKGEQREFVSALLLSRSRYISPATRTLRFYREYFQADAERVVTKQRRRWHIDFRSMRFYVNLDQLLDPETKDYFVEIKSRTWSLKDAENKADAILALMTKLGIHESDIIRQEYVTLAGNS